MDVMQPGQWSAARRAVETRAVAWLAARRALTDPSSAHSDRVMFTRKALLETAFLVGLRARLDPDPLDGDYALLMRQVQDITSRPSYRELIARDEAALLLYAGTYAALKLCGHDDPQFRHIIQQASAGGYATVFERIPYRQLDLLHTLEMCQIGNSLPTVDQVLPLTLLCNRPNVTKLADRDIYAITHTVFYATDFGLREPRWPVGTGLGEIVELLEALLVLTRARKDADLVGEVLCCLLCLGVKEADSVGQAWDFLASVQEKDGRVNGPPGIVHTQITEGDSDYQSWATGYHTTIVAALAGILHRSPRTCNPQRAVAPPGPCTAPTDTIHRAVEWLCRTSVHHPPETGLPAAAASAYGATAIGDPRLARPALVHFATELTDADQGLWQKHGMEIVGEFAAGLRTLGITCPSLDRFLKAISDIISSLTEVPPQAAANVHRLTGLGLLAPERATALTARKTPQSNSPEQNASLLPGLIKTYDLSRIASVVRDLVTAGWGEHRITRDAVAFLTAQQNPNGAFGYPARDDLATRDRAQLSWTQSIVTALAELGNFNS
ncbi:DUF6895 family protein [Streptomyces sp. NBC_00133]|uniref:DUF6895 family protein n=1 Tax=Streptomyces sp. NBC_00133 TaxID=2903624 RepID=UPI0038650FA5